MYHLDMLRHSHAARLRAIVLCLFLGGVAFAGSEEIAKLVQAYPEHLVASVKPNVVAWKDGSEMPFDDGVAKTDFEDLLNRASLKDQMATPYPLAWPQSAPALNEDPGRARNDAFFRKMYGGSSREVEAHLAAVPWIDGKTVRFTHINGADGALREVAEDISKMPAEVRRYVAKPAGTFLWRPIAGTERISMHAFGAAIDFELPKPLYRYWKWNRSSAQPVYPAAVLADANLRKIVEVFERHGFIWGGKWFHYDTMHFEYRPELVVNLAPDASPRAREPVR